MKTIVVSPDNNSGIFRLVNEVECGLYRVNGTQSLVKVDRYNDSTCSVSPSDSFDPNMYEEINMVIDDNTKVRDEWVEDANAEHLISKKKVVKLNSSYYNIETLAEEVVIKHNYIELPDGKFLLNRVNNGKFASLLIINTVPGFAMTIIDPRQANADGGEWAVLFGDFYKSTDGYKCFIVKGESDSKHVLVLHKSNDLQEGTALDLSKESLFNQHTNILGVHRYFYVLKSDMALGDIIAKRAERLVRQK